MTSSFLAGLVLVKHLSVLENPADICTSHTHHGQFRIELGDRHKVLVVMVTSYLFTCFSPTVFYGFDVTIFVPTLKCFLYHRSRPTP